MSITKEPAPRQNGNEVQVKALESKILGIKLYTEHAEVSRLFKVDLSAGQNNITISGLPTLMKEDTLRYVCILGESVSRANTLFPGSMDGEMQ